mmetsp:Transcript_31378/g.61987  ORF Transcript_31378/g.61987 Transcript_31378/m.61987 type:complete len:87 (+) Transcript_31378:28-288(+)
MTIIKSKCRQARIKEKKMEGLLKKTVPDKLTTMAPSQNKRVCLPLFSQNGHPPDCVTFLSILTDSQGRGRKKRQKQNITMTSRRFL